MKVLGISGYHDSSSTLIEDGKILLYLKEERLSGNKRDMFPLFSLNHILQNYEVDHIVTTSDFPDPNVFKNIILKKFSKNFNIADYSLNHHLCHASLAFYNSGFDKALVFVIDRNGSIINNCMREAETVFEAYYPNIFNTLHKNYWIFNTGADSDSARIETLRQLKKESFSFNIDSHMSIVKVYESATTLIKQGPLENGKTMGLASYGKDKNFKQFFHNGRPVDNLFVHDYFIQNSISTTLLLDHVDMIPDSITEENYQFYADYAYQVQKQTQTQVASFVGEWISKTGIKNVCITGGYGLNVVSNENLIKTFPDINFYFEPLADDSGNSIGAAMHLYRKLTNDCNIYRQEHTFFHGIKKQLTDVGKSCTMFEIADYINQGKTIAVFNGLAEAGPRALGNRSILFDARNPNAKHIVNKIKKREWYRPFAGIILEEKFQEYFETHDLKESPNMTISFQCKKTKNIPGVVHVDNSCRIQTVNEDIPHIYNLLRELFVMTGCPVVLNTSFNMAGKPLIETQDQAIDCFENSELDVLWFPEIERCLIKNKEEE